MSYSDDANPRECVEIVVLGVEGKTVGQSCGRDPGVHYLRSSALAPRLGDKLGECAGHADVDGQRVEGRHKRGQGAKALGVDGRALSHQDPEVQLSYRHNGDRGSFGQRAQRPSALASDEHGGVQDAASDLRRFYLGHSSSIVAPVADAMSPEKARSSGASANTRATSSRGTNALRASPMGTRSATGRPSTVTRSRSPASTSRSTRAIWLRSSR